MPGGPSPCGAGGGTLPAQKLTSAEGSQAAARQGKPSSIPLAGAAEPAPPSRLRAGPRAPAQPACRGLRGGAPGRKAPLWWRRRPVPAASPRRLSPRPRREREARGGGMGTALGGRRRREWLTLRRQPGAGSGAPRARAAHEGSAPLSSAPLRASSTAPRRPGCLAVRDAQLAGLLPRRNPAAVPSLTHSLTDRPGLAPSPRETTAMGRPHRQPAHGTARYSPPVSESWRSLPEAKGHRFALGLSAKSHHRRLTKKIFIARQFR